MPKLFLCSFKSRYRKIKIFTVYNCIAEQQIGNPTELDSVQTEWRGAYSKPCTSHLAKSVLITGAPSFRHIMMYINRVHLSDVKNHINTTILYWIAWENQRKPWIQTSKLCWAELKGKAGYKGGSRAKHTSRKRGAKGTRGMDAKAGDPLSQGGRDRGRR